MLARPTTPEFGQSQTVQLTIGAPLEPERPPCVAALLLNNTPTQTLMTRQARDKGAIEVVDDPDDALSFSGIAAPVMDKRTTYTIDARAAWPIRQVRLSSWSLTGEFKADKRPQADPDSASFFLHTGRRSDVSL